MDHWVGRDCEWAVDSPADKIKHKGDVVYECDYAFGPDRRAGDPSAFNLLPALLTDDACLFRVSGSSTASPPCSHRERASSSSPPIRDEAFSATAPFVAHLPAVSVSLLTACRSCLFVSSVSPVADDDMAVSSNVSLRCLTYLTYSA